MIVDKEIQVIVNTLSIVGNKVNKMLSNWIFIQSVYILIVHIIYFCYSERKINIEKCSDTKEIFPREIYEAELHMKTLKIQKYEKLGNIITQIKIRL